MTDNDGNCVGSRIVLFLGPVAKIDQRHTPGIPLAGEHSDRSEIPE